MLVYELESKYRVEVSIYISLVYAKF